jgi:hypothetical protein
MAMVRHTVGKELTPEKAAEMKAEIEAAARRPYVHDPDSPLIKAQTKKDLSPEQIERIKAAQKRHAAIDPGCEKLTPEELINWHPVGGISWEERARRINAKLREDGLILLNSTGSLGRLPGTIEIPLETAHWFADFLNGTESSSAHEADETTYKAERDPSGNVTFTETRGGFVSDLVFASWEIQNISDGLLQEEKERAIPVTVK